MNANLIVFSPYGTARCFWTAVPLHELGRLEISRASRIEFENATQRWQVMDNKRRVRFFSKSRAACLQWEQQNLQSS